MPLVEEYWSGAVKRLQAEVDVFNKLIGHAGEQGRENELSLVRLLENLIPRRLGVGSGMIIDSDDKRSHQTDIVIYDLADQPSLLAQSTQAIFPVEVVHTSIEVKTTLSADDLEECGEKRVGLRKLLPATGYEPPPFVLLAYAAWVGPEKIAEHLRKLPPEQRPDLLCILNPGVVGGPLYDDPPGSYAVDFVPLHASDAKGQRISGEWWPLESGKRGTKVEIKGSLYPITLISKKRTVGDPGRGLLLFCDALTRALAERNKAPRSIIGHYLKGPAIQTISL